MKISTLRCEPNTDIQPGMGVIGQSTYTKHLWHVVVDGKPLAVKAMPIGPSDPWIELEADEEYPIRGDGYRWVSVRRLDAYVIWTNALPTDWFGESKPGLRLGEVLAFPLDLYVAETARCVNADLENPGLAVNPAQDKPPVLEPSELSALLSMNYPDVDEAPLYTLPPIASDPLGQKLLNVVKRRFIKEVPAPIQLAESVRDMVELRIGLDQADYPECVWQIGKTDDGFAVCFLAYPSFPLWLCGKHVDQTFGPLGLF